MMITLFVLTINYYSQRFKFHTRSRLQSISETKHHECECGMWIFVPKKLSQCGQWEFQHWLKSFVRFNWPKETLICECYQYCYSIFDRLSTKLLTFGHIINIFREGGKNVPFSWLLLPLVFSFNHHQGFQFGLTCKLLTSHLGILHIFWWRETCHSLKAYIWNLITN